jgi:hypothetical protein
MSADAVPATHHTAKGMFEGTIGRGYTDFNALISNPEGGSLGRQVHDLKPLNNGGGPARKLPQNLRPSARRNYGSDLPSGYSIGEIPAGNSMGQNGGFLMYCT